MTAALQNAKGPADDGASPDHGSNIPPKEFEMNEQSNSTADAAAPAFEPRTAEEIVSAVSDVLPDVFWLKQAAEVADEYITMDLRQSRTDRLPFDYGLHKDQVERIQYITMHVRDLAAALDKAMNRAFGEKVQA